MTSNKRKKWLQLLEIGIAMLGLSVGLYFLGIIFIFDRALLLLANLCFIGGLYLLIGITAMIKFFTKSGKRRSSGFFFLGFFLLILKFGFIGGIVQIWSLFLLFRSFFPFIFEYLYSVPFVGPFLKNSSAGKWMYSAVNKDRKPNI